MDPSKSPSAPPAHWNPQQKPSVDSPPPPYQDYAAGYNPPPGVYPNQSGYPQAQPYGVPYGQPHPGQFQAPYSDQAAVVVQPAVYITQAPLAHPLPDYLGYSIFTMLCCCLPLGVAALIYSVNTRDANRTGHRPLAERYSRLARTLNNTALGIGITFIVLYIIILAMNIAMH